MTSNETITAVHGLRAGHATDISGKTGCTVLLGPFRAACDVRGLATGTRELETLAPLHLVPQVDAIMLTGGSAYGLAAADGVMSWIAEHDGGFDTGVVRVPIVPAAVIFDLNADRLAPDAATGRRACEAAHTTALAEGRTGAGTGATIGKLRGPAHADPGGVGTHATRFGDFTIAAFAVVNALGDVIDFDGTIIAGTRNDDGTFLDTFHALSSFTPENMGAFGAPATNTTLAVVATDAPLSRVALQSLARAASCAIVRRIAPSNTVFDGDVVFALSTATDIREFGAPEMLALGVTAQMTLEKALIRAARAGRTQ